MTKKVPYALIILDGWGERDAIDSNAIKLAKTPVLDQLQKTRPHCLISCSGEDVGLPAGQMGNSEVGHMTLGAGRVIDQDLTRINKAIAQGDFFKNAVLMESMDQLVATGNALHIMGLLSPGGVHSHEDQMQAAVRMAFERGLRACLSRRSRCSTKKRRGVTGQHASLHRQPGPRRHRLRCWTLLRYGS